MDLLKRNSILQQKVTVFCVIKDQMIIRTGNHLTTTVYSLRIADESPRIFRLNSESEKSASKSAIPTQNKQNVIGDKQLLYALESKLHTRGGGGAS